MSLIDFREVKGPVDWLNAVFKAAIANGWSDLQLRLIRDDEIVALGQGGAGSKLILRARINRQMTDAAVLDGAKALACTVADLWLDPDALARIRAEFEVRKAATPSP